MVRRSKKLVRVCLSAGDDRFYEGVEFRQFLCCGLATADEADLCGAEARSAVIGGKSRPVVCAEKSQQASLDREALRRDFGWTERRIMLTTGLLSPNKGLHHVITALPRIAAAHPDILFVVAGATHPNLVRTEGEACRQSLMDLAASLGVADNVQFINRFASREELVRMIVAADLFVTPYLSEAQITSGVLAYASGLGKPVISTPYWHASELLNESRGVLVPFASPDAIAEAAVALLGDGERLQRMSAGASAHGRQTTWSQTGRQYLQLLDEVSSGCLPPPGRRPPAEAPVHVPMDHLHRPLNAIVSGRGSIAGRIA